MQFITKTKVHYFYSKQTITGEKLAKNKCYGIPLIKIVYWLSLSSLCLFLLFQCFLFHLDHGLRSGGGIGNVHYA